MKAFSSLRSLLVYLVLAAVAPLCVFALIRSVANSDRDITRARENLELTATAVAHTQERVVDSARQLLVSIASVPRLVGPDIGKCSDYLRTLKEELRAYSNIGVISAANGTRLCHSVATAVGDYLGDREYFQAAMARGGFAASGYLIGRVSKKPVVAFALPFKNAQGQATAVAFATLHFDELAKAVGDIKLPPGSHLLIMDRAGIVLADNVGSSTALGKPVANPLLLKAIQSGARGMLEGPDTNGTQKIYALAQTSPASDSAFFVAMGMDLDAVLAPSRQQLTLSVAVLLLVTGLGCLVAWVIGSRAIVKPTLSVLQATRGIQAGHLDTRIAAGRRHHELALIAAGFNKMAATLEQHEAELMLDLSRSEQASETLDLIVNSLQDGLIAVDSKAHVLRINDAARKLFDLDFSITPVSGGWPQRLGLFVPGTAELYAMEDLPLYKSLQGESGESQHIWVKNALVPGGRLISVRYRPFSVREGETGGLMVFTDITELDKLQKEQTKNDLAMRESQRQLLEAQRMGRIGHWQMNSVAQAVSWSEQMYELFGLKPGTYDGRPETFLQMLHPADRARYTERREQAMRDNEVLDIEYRIVTPARQIRWMHQIGQTHLDKDGQTYFRAGVVQDITARKQTELALARSTDLLQRAGKIALVGGWEISFAPLTAHWTDEIFVIRELEPGTRLSARRAIRFFTRDARPLFLGAVRAAMAHGRPWDLELPLITAKGRHVWMRTQGQAVYRDGVLFGLSGVSQDITAQHNALAQLRLLETCVSRLNDIVLITEAEPFDMPGPRIVFVNDAFERQTGYTREEVIGKTPRILLGPNTQKFTLNRIGATLKKWRPVRAELINYTKAGEEFWLEVDIVPIANTGGQFTHWVAVERDITKRKLAEQAIRDSEQRYFELFENAPVPMWVYDAETYRFLAVNSAAVNDYGYSQAEFLSMTIFDIRSEAEARRLKQYLALKTPDFSQRWLHRRKGGSELTVRSVNRPIQHAGKCAKFAVVMDVSAQVQAENEVNDYLATLQRAAIAAKAIPLHLSIYDLMSEVAVQARIVIGAHQAVVSLCNDADWANATHTFSLSEKYAEDAVGKAEPASEPGKLLSTVGADVYGLACKSAHAVRLTQAELESHPGWLDAAGFANHRPTMRGWMAIPLVGRSGTNIGLLQLSDKFKGDFTLHDEYVATELAQLASIVIENAQLLEEVHQLNSGLEQKVAKRTAALARQEALFRAVAEQAPQVIWTADSKGRITYGNRAWFDLMGGHMSDWDGLKWMTAIHAEDLPQVKANWALSVANQIPFSGMRRLLAKDGSYHVMSYRASPVLNAEGKVDFWVGIDADVTEIKAIEAALRLSNQELESFSYSVSHDLRSPLNTIDGFSRLLSKQLGTNVSDTEKHFLARIRAGVKQMGTLIDDLLSLAQGSRVQLRNEAIDLTVISRRIAEELQARQPGHRRPRHCPAWRTALGRCRH
jgi:PAS domain S-box-containing protein